MSNLPNINMQNNVLPVVLPSSSSPRIGAARKYVEYHQQHEKQAISFIFFVVRKIGGTEPKDTSN